jgi:hypothetical protein
MMERCPPVEHILHRRSSVKLYERLVLQIWVLRDAMQGRKRIISSCRSSMVQAVRGKTTAVLERVAKQVFLFRTMPRCPIVLKRLTKGKKPCRSVKEATKHL